MAKNLPKAMPCKASYVYDNGTGARSESATRIIKNQGDLRAKPGKNDGK